ncbi:MAG: hypothetical protein Q9225_001847 [Loekoesia sp. 1 TL-2023]
MDQLPDTPTPSALMRLTSPGAIISGASPAYNIEEMTYALKSANAKFLMTIPTSMEVAAAAAQNAGIPKNRIFLLDGNMDGYTTMKQLLDIGRSNGPGGQVPSFRIPTGKQNKDVIISHQNIIAQSLQIQQITPSDVDKVLAVLPCFHNMLDTAVKYKIIELLVVPPILIRLVRDPIVDQYDLSHLCRFLTGAAPVSEEIIQLLQKKFPQTKFRQGKAPLGYGMTESCGCVTAHPPEMYDYKYAHAVGTLISCTEAKIIDLDGKELGVNEPGEVLARGPQVVMGYLNNPKATAETFDSDGWLHTGDQGFFNEEGLLRITDRIKEMIKVKGIGVAPAELEDLLLGHPEVEDTAVLGLHDDYSGERPKAYVTPKRGVTADEALARDLIRYVKDRKVRHKWITEIEFVGEIPKSASGKILRRVLRDKSKETSNRNVIIDEVKEKAKL